MNKEVKVVEGARRFFKLGWLWLFVFIFLMVLGVWIIFHQWMAWQFSKKMERPVSIGSYVFSADALIFDHRSFFIQGILEKATIVIEQEKYFLPRLEFSFFLGTVKIRIPEIKKTNWRLSGLDVSYFLSFWTWPKVENAKLNLEQFDAENVVQDHFFSLRKMVFDGDFTLEYSSLEKRLRVEQFNVGLERVLLEESKHSDWDKKKFQKFSWPDKKNGRSNLSNRGASDGFRHIIENLEWSSHYPLRIPLNHSFRLEKALWPLFEGEQKMEVRVKKYDLFTNESPALGVEGKIILKTKQQGEMIAGKYSQKMKFFFQQRELNTEYNSLDAQFVIEGNQIPVKVFSEVLSHEGEMGFDLLEKILVSFLNHETKANMKAGFLSGKTTAKADISLDFFKSPKHPQRAFPSFLFWGNLPRLLTKSQFSVDITGENLKPLFDKLNDSKQAFLHGISLQVQNYLLSNVRRQGKKVFFHAEWKDGELVYP